MKKILVVILLAVTIGGGLAFYMFKDTVDSKSLKEKTKEVINAKAFQIGVYSNYENAKKASDRNNGVIVIDNNVYRVYTVILTNEESTNKILNYYNKIGLNYYLKDITIPKDYYNEIKDYETLLISSSEETYTTITKKIISQYSKYI